MKTSYPLTTGLVKAFFVLVAAGFSSCSKSNSSEAYHVSCNVDGTPGTFNADALAHYDIDASTGEKSLVINGFTALSQTAGNMGFAIFNVPSGDSIAVGTYTDTSTNFEVLASFDTNTADADDYEAGTTTYQDVTTSGNTIANHFTVHITAITATTVKGTFSGDFYHNGDPGGTKKSITNGDFYVKRQ